MSNSNNNGNNNLNYCSLFIGALTIAFIILKLCDKIAWSWVWVLSPIWMSLCFMAAVFLIIVLIASIKVLIDCHRAKKQFAHKKCHKRRNRDRD